MTSRSTELDPSGSKKGPLARLDEWLRIHYPIIWRTRIHYFLLFSLVLTNLSLLSFAYFYPLTLESFLFTDQLANLVVLVRLIGLLFLLYWVYKQIRTPVGEQSVAFYWKTWFFYSLCLFMVFINSIVFLAPIGWRTAGLLEDETFQRIYEYHSNVNFWNCDPVFREGLLTQEYGLIRADLLKLKLIKENSNISIQSSLNGKRICPNGGNCLVGSSEGNLGIELKSILSTIKEAKQLQMGQDSFYNSYYQAWLLIGLYLIVLPLVILLLCIPKYRFNRSGSNKLFRPIWIFKGFDYAKFVASTDNYFLRHYPLLWSTKFHTYVLHAMVLSFSLIILGVLVEYWYGLDWFFWGLPDFVQEVESESFLLIMVFLGVLFSSVFWAIYQSKNKYLPIDFSSNFLLILIYFFLIYLVPVTVLVAIHWLTSSSDVRAALILTSLSSIPFVTWVYSSKFMSKRQSLLYSLITFFISIVGLFMLFSFTTSDQFSLLGLGFFYLLFFGILLLAIQRGWNKLVHFLTIFYLSSLSVGVTILLALLRIFGLFEGDLKFIFMPFSILLFGLLFIPAIMIFLRLGLRPKSA